MENEKVNMEDLKEIELENYDVTEFIGQKTIIAKIDVNDGTNGKYVSIRTDVLDVKNGREIRASRNFGLQKDKNGVWGWGKETKLGTFISEKGVKNLSELIGIPVRTNIEDKNGRKWLSFF